MWEVALALVRLVPQKVGMAFLSAKNLSEARAEIRALRKSVRYYIKRANDNSAVAADQRARRFALEQELDAIEKTWHIRAPLVRYIERNVSKPMPPKIVPGPVRYIICWHERPAGFFGRAGDRIDRLFKRGAPHAS